MGGRRGNSVGGLDKGLGGAWAPEQPPQLGGKKEKTVGTFARMENGMVRLRYRRRPTPTTSYEPRMIRSDAALRQVSARRNCYAVRRTARSVRSSVCLRLSRKPPKSLRQAEISALASAPRWRAARL